MELVSIIIPIWNGEKYIAETLDSVFEQGIYTQVILIDDGSTDNSVDVIKQYTKFENFYLHQITHSGIARACNTGLQLAKGQYCLFLDQDDLLLPKVLIAMRNSLSDSLQFDYVQTMAEDFISPDLTILQKRSLVPREKPYYGQMSGATMLRKEILQRTGLFNEEYKAGQMVDYMLRVQQVGGKGQKLDFISVKRRLHANNTSRTMKQQQFSDYGAMLRQRLAAKR